LRDYEDLERLFAGKPELVLSYFAQAQIGCLMELALYERMMQERPPVAARIALVAATMGIREGKREEGRGKRDKGREMKEG
jgi:hypothetical protein